jgi:hypothetical protein
MVLIMSLPALHCPSLVYCAVLAVVGGCAAASDPNRAAPQVAQAPKADADRAVPQASERKIIYTSQIEVVVEDLSAAQRNLLELIKPIEESGGYLSSQDVTGTTGQHRRGSWTVRVPIAKFDQFVASVERLGEVERSSRQAQDVTEAYMDLSARLRNKQASEARLLSHLEKTGELKDTLECERELSRVRGEIEQMQGQLNLLKNKTDLATIEISLFERLNFTPKSSPGFGTQIQRTFDVSWKSLLQVGQIIVLMVVALVPWLMVILVIAAPIGLVVRLRSRNAAKRHGE